MDRYVAAINRAAQQAAASVPQGRFGLVQSVDGARAAARVLIQPEGVLTGWLPIMMASAGSGWGAMTVPGLGDMAFLVPDAGSQDYVIVGFGHNDQRRPASVPAAIGGGAAPAKAGEVVLTHSTGTVLRLADDGSVYIRGAVNIEGDLKVSGEIRDLNGTRGTIDDLRAAYDGHTHSDPQGGSVGPPSDVTP